MFGWSIYSSQPSRYVNFWELLTNVSRICSTVSAGLFVSHCTANHSAQNFLYHSRFAFSFRRWFCVVLGPKPLLRRHIDSILANSRTQNSFLFAILAMFRHDCPLVVKPASTPWRQLPKYNWRDSLAIDMFLSAVSVLDVALPSLEIPEGLNDYNVFMALGITFTPSLNVFLWNTRKYLSTSLRVQ